MGKWRMMNRPIVVVPWERVLPIIQPVFSLRFCVEYQKACREYFKGKIHRVDSKTDTPKDLPSLREFKILFILRSGSKSLAEIKGISKMEKDPLKGRLLLLRKEGRVLKAGPTYHLTNAGKKCVDDVLARFGNPLPLDKVA
jgi:hypothetical protein